MKIILGYNNEYSTRHFNMSDGAVTVKCGNPDCGKESEEIIYHNLPEQFSVICETCGYGINLELNKRNTFRKQVNLEARLRLTENNLEHPVLAEIVDLSTGGMRLKVPSHSYHPSSMIPSAITELKGKYLFVDFTLDDNFNSEIKNAKCEVVNTTETDKAYYLGIRFESLNQQEIKDIGFYIL